MIAFVTKTGAGGFAFDHGIRKSNPNFKPPPGEDLTYEQWRAWMHVLAAVRAAHPDIVIDHRQNNHMFGPCPS